MLDTYPAALKMESTTRVVTWLVDKEETLLKNASSCARTLQDVTPSHGKEVLKIVASSPATEEEGRKMVLYQDLRTAEVE